MLARNIRACARLVANLGFMEQAVTGSVLAVVNAFKIPGTVLTVLKVNMEQIANTHAVPFANYLLRSN